MVAFGSNRGERPIWPFAKRTKARSLGGWNPPPREFQSCPASLWAQFTRLIPEICNHTQSALRPDESIRLQGFLCDVVASAFEVYRRLAESGLSELAYPKPLCMAALVWLRHTGSRDES
jgi:hypothetical protein